MSNLSFDDLRMRVADLEKQINRLSKENQEISIERDLYKSIVNSMPVQIYAKDKKSRFIACNPAVIEALKAKDIDDVLGKTDFDFIPEEQAKMLFALEQKIIKNGKPSIDNEVSNKDKTRWSLQTKKPLRDKNNNVSGIVGINRDITELKNLLIAMEKSEEKYRAVFENSNNCIFLLDIKSKKVIEGNPAFQKLLGYSIDEIGGLLVYDFIAHSKKEIDKNIKKTISQKKYYVGERQYRKKDGTITDVEVKGYLITYGDKEMLCVISSDITERKKDREALYLERFLLRTLIDNIPDAIFIKNTESKFAVCNQATAGWLGAKSPADIEGKSDFDFMPEEKAKHNYAVEQNVMKKCQPVINKEISDDDGKRWVQYSNIPYRDKQGNVLGMVGIGRDITENKLAEIALQESEERFRDIFNGAVDGIIYTSDDGKIIDVNPAFCEITGTTRKELIGKNSLDLAKKVVNIKGQPFITEIINESIAEGQIPEFDLKLEDKIVHISSNVFEKNRTGITAILRDITEAKKAELALKESEEKYRDIVEKAKISIALNDLKGNFVFSNKNHARLFGYTQDEIKKLSFTDLIHRDDVKRISEYHKARINGKETPSQYEAKGIKKDGSVFNIEIYTDVVTEDKKVTGTRSYFWDITERKKAELALRESEEKFRNIFDNAKDAIIYLNNFGKILDVNKCAIDMCGLKKEDIVGKHFKDLGLFSLKEIPMMIKIIKSTQRGRENITVDLPMINANGDNIALECVAAYLKPNVMVVARDITTRKRSEQALKESEEKFRRTFDDSPIGAAIIDLNYNYVSVNKELCRITGYSEKEMITMKFHEITHPDDLKINLNFVKKLLKGKINQFKFEKRYLRKDGKTVWVHVYSRVIKDSNGKPIYYVPLIEDVTYRKKLEEELRQYTRNLENLVNQRTEQMLQSAKLASLGTFAAGVAHEKRQYMQVVLSSAGRILEAGDKFRKEQNFEGYINFVKERVRSIEKSVNASNTLVNSLLAYSKGDPEILKKISVNTQIDSILNILSHSIEKDQIEIIKDIKSTPEIFGNDMQIREIIMNLLSNAHYAVKSSDNKNKKIKISLYSRKKNIFITIEDSGTGIPKKIQKQVFDPFFTTKSPQVGTGLGLSLVSKFVDNHKGSIKLNSKKGKGTIFKIKIPINNMEQR